MPSIRKGYVKFEGNVATITLTNSGSEAQRKWTLVGDTGQAVAYSHGASGAGIIYFAVGVSLTAANYATESEGFLAPGVPTLIETGEAGDFVSFYHAASDVSVSLAEVQ